MTMAVSFSRFGRSSPHGRAAARPSPQFWATQPQLRSAARGPLRACLRLRRVTEPPGPQPSRCQGPSSYKNMTKPGPSSGRQRTCIDRNAVRQAAQGQAR
ncbi:hypothetical protein NDU88_000348 [Pleurodeles waltl]|uniref:Uncharacterized protein n=1 Tax=Pleurodeles waltl TaxID=8319 RepID=A0AAV7TEP9_PLEWA|nr:hypothetical protein NDU88_000348 [Pleurodeles waltl]